VGDQNLEQDVQDVVQDLEQEKVNNMQLVFGEKSWDRIEKELL